MVVMCVCFATSITYFIGICVIVSLLALTPILTFISQIFMPLLSYLNIPTQLSPGILFSIIRKDGMLLFNMHDGFWLKQLSSLQLLLLVFSAQRSHHVLLQ